MTKIKEEKSLVLNDKTAESLISKAIEHNLPVDTMERLLAMRRELKAEKAKEEYDRGMSAFQADCPTIEKTKVVKNKDGSTRYKFAPIEKIVEQVKPTIQKHGFSYTIDSIVEEGWVTALCKITHEFGHFEVSHFKVPIDKEGFMSQPQKFAAALTFAKRYAFCNAFGILTGDEDNDAPTEDNESIYNEAVKIIKQAKDIKGLQRSRDGIMGSKKYTDSQKSSLVDLIEARIQQLS